MNTHHDCAGNASENSTPAGLLLTSFLCLLAAALLLVGYALGRGSALLGSLGLQLMLAAVSVLSCWFANRLRQRFAVANSSIRGPAHAGDRL
jgi:hypothetical protein